MRLQHWFNTERLVLRHFHLSVFNFCYSGSAIFATCFCLVVFFMLWKYISPNSSNLESHLGPFLNFCREGQDKKKSWSIHNELPFAILFTSAIVCLCITVYPNFHSSLPCLLLTEKFCFSVAEILKLWSWILFFFLKACRISRQTYIHCVYGTKNANAVFKICQLHG